MQPMANMALRAARLAGTRILRAMDRIDSLKVETKARNDFVSNIDREAEALIVETLEKAYPEHGFLGEESGERRPDAEYRWVIDPLDGTTNFLRGIPHFCISIACMKGRQIEHGVIVDPVRNEEFVASRGAGAQLNGKRIRVARRDRLDGALLVTGIPPRAVDQHLDAYLGMLRDFVAASGGMRRGGSAALDLAYVAAGRADGYWEFGLGIWDVAAGALLVKEAGGFVGDLAGGDDFLEGRIVAANPKLFKIMVQTIRPHLTAALR